MFCNIHVRFIIETERCGCKILFMNGDTENVCLRTSELSVGITLLFLCYVAGHIYHGFAPTWPNLVLNKLSPAGYLFGECFSCVSKTAWN
jgi:hypothetical protein